MSQPEKPISEQDVCTKLITPALLAAGWNLHTQLRQEVIHTAGRITVQGRKAQRGQKKRADYVLYFQPTLGKQLLAGGLSLGLKRRSFLPPAPKRLA